MRQRLTAEDTALLYAATAPIADVEAQYRRIGAVLAQRRRSAKIGAPRRRTPAPAVVEVVVEKEAIA